MNEEPRDTPYTASYEGHKQFATSPIWRDLTAEVRGWMQAIQNGLESADSFDDVRLFQGSLRACRRFLTLPEEILEKYDAALGAKMDTQDMAEPIYDSLGDIYGGTDRDQ